MDQAKTQAVKLIQTYIKENITNAITLHELGDASGYSPYHAAKVFREVIGMPPFEYIRKLRLTEAAKVLRDVDVHVIDVAFDFVFGTHEGFTRAFTKEFGVRPKTYSKQKQPIKWFLPYDVHVLPNKKEKGESTVEKTRFIFTQIVERPARKAIVKRGVKATHYFEYCDEVGCDIWGMLVSVKDALYEPVGLWLPSKLIKPGTSKYVQGVEVPVDYDKEIPEGYEIIDLEPCTMMIFQGQPYPESEFREHIGYVMDAIETFNPEVYGYAWDDDFAPRFQLEPQGYRGYIEARPIRKL
ncbi:MAG: helix-turn-helix transcriptional regulator [Bacilli bacterium]|nr:helix-turn-helix transcriptional regulator [Bacilli bacterium]MBN2696896.1 helix-turn-helix transcriptional regulator [Bacilli bacterium]